jgi:hypothetical protein
MVVMSCKAWPSSQSWVRLSTALVASGLSSRNANGMMISKKSMRTKTATAMTWVAVEDFPVTRSCSAVR